MRSKKAAINMIFALTSYFFVTIFSFVTQAYIIKILGIEYSGINGLFTNILTLLSIAELGIGNIIIFKLYKPLANKKYEEIKSWMKFYKICYRIIALIISVIGIILIPFLPLLIKENIISENIQILYIISILDVIFSYVMTYKRSILYADQKNYVINIVHIGYTILMNITQIIILYMTKKYLYFLITKLFYRIIENFIINLYVNKKYPYIKDKANNISVEEKKDVLRRVFAILLQKISFVINKGIDSVIISILLGITLNGYYTNYNLIVTGLSGVMYQIISALTASVGNLLTENNKDKNFEIYKKINIMNMFIIAIAIACFVTGIQSFIEIWLGKEYILSMCVVISFGIYIYADSSRRTITIFKEAAGICKEDQHMYIFMALINLIFSIILCKIIGISGVILGTAFSYIFLICISYPKYIFEPVFNKSKKIYFIENLKYFVFIIISTFVSFQLANQIIIRNVVFNFIIKMIITCIIVSVLFCIVFRRAEEFKYYKNMLIKRRVKVNNGS